MKLNIFNRWTAIGLVVSTLFGSVGTLGADATRPIPLLSRLGNLHHPVTTTNELAQRYFDQGLTFIFGFNHDAAIRSFKRALEQDSNLAMAHWGIGLALGPNINLPVSPEAEKAAYDSVQKALALADKASEAERDYIQALATRYSIEPGADLQKLDRDYSAAMRKVVEKHVDDIDAKALYAESLMDLRPWQLWDAEGNPAEGTLHIVEVIEDVLRREPNHPGANHYYIHAVEASRNPERALPSAARLETYAPAAGHLVHMPSHIYIRTGNYAEAARRNEVASEADFDFLQACGVQGFYPAMYTSHNLHFAAVAHLLQGKYAAARRYAERLLTHVKPMAAQSAELESFLPTLEQVLVAFEKWDDILALPQPEEKFKLHRGIWHYARGIAFAAKRETNNAHRELKALTTLRDGLPSDAGFGPFNKAHAIFTIAEKQVAARIALETGEAATAVALLEQAVPIEDSLRYMEPPDWYIYTREALGGALLSAGRPADAERIFRADLERNHRKGRALYGLKLALEKQGKTAAAKLVGRGLDKAWENADSELRPQSVWLARL
jgi:hypothetical protein